MHGRPRRRTADVVRRAATRVLAVGAFVAAAVAAWWAVTSALDANDAGDAATTGTVSFGAARVTRSPAEDGGVCFTLSRVGVVLKRTCVARVGAEEIATAVAKRRSGQLVIGGLTGSSVAEVRIQLRPSGTVSAPLQDGAFYVAVPPRKTPAAVVKVLDDGRATAVPVASS